MKLSDDPPSTTPVPAARRGAWARLVLAGGLALALEWAIWLYCSWCPSSPEEGIILRWVRIVEAHPMRTGLAFALCLLALRGPPEGSAQATGRRGPPPPW